MKTSPKRLTEAEINEITKGWEIDLREPEEINGGNSIQKLIRHIAYLEGHIKLLTPQDP